MLTDAMLIFTHQLILGNSRPPTSKVGLEAV